LVPKVIANGVVRSGRLNISEVISTLVVSIILDEARRDDVEIVDNIGE
jgi:hypothetical protein